MRRRQFAFAAVAGAALIGAACGDDGGEDAAPVGSGGSSSVTSFEERTLDTWQVGDDGSGTMTNVTGVLRQSDACSEIEIDGGRHPVTWPSGSSRTDDGISVDGQLYRFDEESDFTVIQDYDGPQRPVTCLTTTAWLVTE